jgi:hypothetical protein
VTATTLRRKPAGIMSVSSMKISISQKSPMEESKVLLKKHPNALILAHAAYETISRTEHLSGFTKPDHLFGFEPNVVILDFWSLTDKLIRAACIQLGRRGGISRMVLCVKPWPTSALGSSHNN